MQFDKNISTYLNSLRFVAALMVVISHMFQIFYLNRIGLSFIPYYILPFRLMGGIGVIIFFVLSGFVMTHSLSNKKDLWLFIKLRVSRIVPPLWGAIILSMVIYFIIFFFLKITSLDIKGDLYNVRPSLYVGIESFAKAAMLYPDMGLNINGPLWSIGFEWHCYLILTLIVLFKRMGNRLLGVFLIACLVYYINIRIFGFFIIFGIGIFWYWIYSNLNRKRFFYLTFLCTATFFIIFVLFADKSELLKINLFSSTSGLLKEYILVLFISSIMFFGFSLCNDFSENQLIVFLSWNANYSYSMYLIHFPILVIYCICFNKLIGLSIPLLIIVCLIMLISICFISYIFSIFFENKKRFYKILWSKNL